MLTVTVCVGSSCSVRGSDDLAAEFERLIEKEKLTNKIELVGAFCMEMCSMGVSVRVNDRAYKEVRPGDAEAFFYAEIMPLMKNEG
jgi:NADH:ubiquinone oxidoreductase subunit E